MWACVCVDEREGESYPEYKKGINILHIAELSILQWISRPWVLHDKPVTCRWSRQALAWASESRGEKLSHTFRALLISCSLSFSVLVTKRTLLCLFFFPRAVFNLPCVFLHATQWERHIEAFCKEDVSVKDLIYRCCRKDGSDRHDCFHGDALNPSYNPTEELPVSPITTTTEFSFDPSACQRYLWKHLSFKWDGI